MKILVTGGTGQLGRALVRRGGEAAHEVIALDEATLDITSAAAIDGALAAAKPDVVINAAAYTAVDKAESERERAFAVNADGPENLGRACAGRDIALIHVSTDYVFDGTATVPYTEDAPLSPTSVYGDSKAEGERRVRQATRGSAVIVRTSWLFEEKGPSFVHTMLRLAQERPVLRVVADQVGCPTWADDLADALLALHVRGARGTFHFCNDGITSWHGFATAIVDEARTHRAMLCERIDAITTAEFPTPAKRPAYSVLDTTLIRSLDITPPSWRPGLARVVAEVLRS